MPRPDTNPSLTTEEKNCVHWGYQQTLSQGWLCIICQTFSPAYTAIGRGYGYQTITTFHPALFAAYRYELNDKDILTVWTLSTQGNVTYAVAPEKNSVQVFRKNDGWNSITDYAFIYCGKCPPGYCRAQETLPSPCRIHPGCV